MRGSSGMVCPSLSQQTNTKDQAVMEASETPLETRIAWVNQKIDSCNKYLLRVLQDDRETQEELGCENIVRAIRSRAEGEESDYKALVEKLVTEELLEVSVLSAGNQLHLR